MFVKKINLMGEGGVEMGLNGWPFQSRSICYVEGDPEPEPAPAPAPVDPATPPTADPPADPVPADPAPAPAPVAVAPPAKPQPDWKEKKLGKQAARIKELEARLAASGEPAPAPVASPAPGDIDKLVEAKVAQQQFDAQCARVTEAGRKAFADFDEKITGLVAMVDTSDPAESQAYLNLVAAAVETGDEAARVLHELGSDPNEFHRLLQLNPMKMATELAKRAWAKPAPTGNPLTNMPKPIEPVGSRGAQHDEIDPDDPSKADKLSIQAWMERRNAKATAAWNANRGRGAAH